MQEIIKKINEKLKPSGWYDCLRIFLESSHFSDIIVELKRKVDEDKQRFCPALNTAFRFLEECPYDKVTAVMLIDYSCNRLEQADGIPLSVPEGRYPDPTPIPLFQTVHEHTAHCDVNSWVHQGLLIVPLALTSRIEGRSHKKIWEPFIMRIIEAVNKRYPEAPWLLIGDDTHKYREDIASRHVRPIQLKKPMEDKRWHEWVTIILKSQGKAPINWQTILQPQG